MGFSKKEPVARISAARLCAVAGSPAVTAQASAIPEAAAVKAPRVSLEPDMSRIRKNMIDETPAARKKRLAAKTVNFGATIIARLIILGAAGYYAWQTYQFTGQVSRGLGIGLFAMAADLGRVSLKALTPGSK
ncbi:MAG: hypothetical protein DHS20C05_09770 [Hyphococcus sp.]|nr:MAG: hypothetical protein DHS20C05_09770 [Marinicaulis sp.]